MWDMCGRTVRYSLRGGPGALHVANMMLVVFPMTVLRRTVLHLTLLSFKLNVPPPTPFRKLFEVLQLLAETLVAQQLRGALEHELFGIL